MIALRQPFQFCFSLPLFPPSSLSTSLLEIFCSIAFYLSPFRFSFLICSRSFLSSLFVFLRSVKLAPPTHEKISKPIWELWVIYGLSNGARNNFGLFPFSRKMILKWGELASREASPNFFPEVLREI